MINRIKHPDWIAPSDSPLESSQDFFAEAIKRHRSNLLKGAVVYFMMMVLSIIISVTGFAFAVYVAVHVLRWMGVL